MILPTEPAMRAPRQHGDYERYAGPSGLMVRHFGVPKGFRMQFAEAAEIVLIESSKAPEAAIKCDFGNRDGHLGMKKHLVGMLQRHLARKTLGDTDRNSRNDLANDRTLTPAASATSLIAIGRSTLARKNSSARFYFEGGSEPANLLRRAE